jgi:predicted nuclease of predicted toxin-antitoxin system
MRLLFDQNLSFKLVHLLSDLYPNSIHVRDVRLVDAEDFVVWKYAEEHGLIIVSKDSDFHQMSLLYGQPPKTVWSRVGNAPTSIIVTLLREHHADLEAFDEDRNAALLALG